METTSERIRARRAELGMTLEQVGNIVGVGKSTVRKWETGDIRNMRRDKIALLARALRTTPGYLMGWADDDSEESSVDFDTAALREELRRRPGMRVLFDACKDASDDDLLRAVKIIEALKGK